MDDSLWRASDRLYTAYPFMGRRQIHRMLRTEGHKVHLKRLHRSMRVLRLAAVALGSRTRTTHPRHPKYPDLLRGLAIPRPNQVGSSDVTYLPMARGFQYFAAILDGYSRKVLS